MTWRALLLIFSFLPYALTFPCADHPLCDESCSCVGFKRLQYLGDGTTDNQYQGHFMGLLGHTDAGMSPTTSHRYHLDASGILWVLREDELMCVWASQGLWVKGQKWNPPFSYCNTTTDGGNLRWKWLPGGKLSSVSGKCLGQISHDQGRVIATDCDGSHSSHVVGLWAWESCASNTYFEITSRRCEACPFGMTSAAAVADNTHPGCQCPANTYLNSSACVECPPASSSPPGSGSASSCVCNRGYTGPDGSVCVACSAGKFKASLGSQVCSMCEAGTYKASAGVNTECEIVGHTARVTIRLPYTVAEFDTVKQAAYREAMASAAGTVTANVDIVQIEGGRVSAHEYSPGVRVRTRMR